MVDADGPNTTSVPGWLRTGAAWAWRLLLLAGLLYVAARVVTAIYIVVVPCAAALLLTALLQPAAGRLRRGFGGRFRLPSILATWLTLLCTAAVLAGIGFLVSDRVSAEYPTLVTETKHTSKQIQSWLAGPPFRLKGSNVQHFLDDVPHFLSQHKSLVEGTVLTGGRIVAELLGAFVLTLFVTFFLLKDGERADRAGRAAWQALVYYMRGTVAVAAIHALVVGVALWIMGAPLVIPLAVLVFLAAFVPMVGLFIAGALAILVVLASKGWVAAVVLLGVLIIEDQIEG